MSSSPVHDLLASAVVEDVVVPQRKAEGLVFARRDEDVLTIVARLAENHVSSMPVFDEEGNCEGIVDFSDAVAFLLKMDWESMGSLKNGHKIWEELGNVSISKAIDLSQRNPMMFVSSAATLKDAVQLIEENNLRRALVIDDDEKKKIVAVLSPSAIVKFLMFQMKGKDDSTLTESVSKLNIGHSPVESVKKTQTVLEAMHLMHRSRKSVVAVVDPISGALCGSISMSDIKLVFQEHRFSLLVKDCWKYIVEARERSDMETFPFFGVYEEDTFQMVISKLLATNVHHLYVVEKNNCPVRVISFTDICRTLREQYFPRSEFF